MLACPDGKRQGGWSAFYLVQDHEGDNWEHGRLCLLCAKLLRMGACQTSPIYLEKKYGYCSPKFVLGERSTFHDAKIRTKVPEMADRVNREIHNNLFQVHGDCYRQCNKILLPIVFVLLVAVNLHTKSKISPVLINNPCNFGWKFNTSTLLLCSPWILFCWLIVIHGASTCRYQKGVQDRWHEDLDTANSDERGVP